MIPGFAARLRTREDLKCDTEAIYMDGYVITQRPLSTPLPIWRAFCLFACGHYPEVNVRRGEQVEDDPDAWARLETYMAQYERSDRWKERTADKRKKTKC